MSLPNRYSQVSVPALKIEPFDCRRLNHRAVVNYGGAQVGANTTGGVPVLFNLANVTSLGANGMISGSILAPLGTFNTNQSVKGQLFVASVSNVGEVHDQYYSGSLPGAVTQTPEPVTLLLVGSGLVAIRFIRRR